MLTAQQFKEWESETFGFGYGTGEEHVLRALQSFLSLCTKDRGTYDYTVISGAIGPAVTWLLINDLCHADVIEYGTSPRFGWLTPFGMQLREFVCANSLDGLVFITAQGDESDFKGVVP